jgi:Putative redox-active protein (C_GCAxxG_C_C)
MWESYGLGNEDFLWTCIPFMGGISSWQQAPCGVVSASAVSLALRYRCDLRDKEKAKEARKTIRHLSGEVVRRFKKKFGNITCLDLVQTDFSTPGEYKRFRESGISKDKCDNYVGFIIETLYEFENRGETEMPET